MVRAMTSVPVLVALCLLAACAPAVAPGAAGAGAVGDGDVAAGFAREHGLDALDRTVVHVESAGTLRFDVLVAGSAAARSRGLQGVDVLPGGVGMLFVFPDPPGPSGRPGFWMLDTLVPLDIAFVDAGVIVGVATMTPCTELPCPITHPGVVYDMALEVAEGALAGVAVGDRLVVAPVVAR